MFNLKTVLLSEIFFIVDLILGFFLTIVVSVGVFVVDATVVSVVEITVVDVSGITAEVVISSAIVIVEHIKIPSAVKHNVFKNFFFIKISIPLQVINVILIKDYTNQMQKINLYIYNINPF